MLCCEDLLRDYGDDVLLITGPPLGPEGSLLERARAGGVPLEIIARTAPRRSIRGAIWLSYRRIKRSCAAFGPTWSTRTAPRAASWAARPPGRWACRHRPHGTRRTVPSVPGQGGAAVVSGLRTLGRRALPCHGQRGRRHDRLMVDAGVAPREKFTTIYSGMEVEPFLQSAEHRERVRRELGYRPEHVVVGKIARLFHLKGHDDVIRAARASSSRTRTSDFCWSATASCASGSSGRSPTPG